MPDALFSRVRAQLCADAMFLLIFLPYVPCFRCRCHACYALFADAADDADDADTITPCQWRFRQAADAD